MQTIDLLIANGTVITMDPQRRVLRGHSVAVDAGRILDVGPAAELETRYTSGKTIDATRKAVMPGLVDLHAHAATALNKGIAERMPGLGWRNIQDFIGYHASAEWYYVESLLASLEKLKGGTTCSLYMLGTAPRGDSPEHAYANARGVEKIGIRSICGIGPSRPPWPQEYTYWENGRRIERLVSLEETFEATSETIGTWNANGNERVKMWACTSRMMNRNPADQVYDPENEKYIPQVAEGIRELMEKHDVGFHLHAYGSSARFMKDHYPYLLGPRTVMGHGWPFDMDAVEVLAETDTRVAHCPRARRVYYFEGRCPVPEMIEAGVTVGLGSDACGMDRPFDSLFEDIFLAPRWQRRLLNDHNVIPAGKALEMATIDGARALGLDGRIGSIEAGKDADIIVVNLWDAHTVPFFMETHRLAHITRGADVETVLVQGEVLMEDRVVKRVDETEVLEWAQLEAEHTVELFGLEPMMHSSAHHWGYTYE